MDKFDKKLYGFVTQILYKYVLIWRGKICIRSRHNFTYTTTAELPWHVQMKFNIRAIMVKIRTKLIYTGGLFY